MDFINNLKNFKVPEGYIQKSTSVVDGKVIVTIKDIHQFSFFPKEVLDNKTSAEVSKIHTSLTICKTTENSYFENFKDHIQNSLVPLFISKVWGVSYEKALSSIIDAGDIKTIDEVCRGVTSPSFLDKIKPYPDGSLGFCIVAFLDIIGPEYAPLESFFDMEKCLLTDSEDVKFVLAVHLFRDNDEDPSAPIRYEEENNQTSI